MTRTKMVRKKSSMKKRPGLSIVSKLSVSSKSSVSSTQSNRTDDLVNLLSKTYASHQDFLREFEAYCEKKLETQLKGFEAASEHVKNLFNNIINNYPEAVRNTTLSSLYDKSLYEDENKNPNTEDAPFVRQSRLRRQEETSSLDEFKKPKTPRVERSSSRKRSTSVPATAPRIPPPTADIFKTPMMSARKQLASVTTITPKVSQTPVSVMRRPLHGEIAFSTSGSPLLIGPVSTEDIPTVSVPLHDGRVFSILPDPTARPADIPEIDAETRKYLKTLREHLEILAPGSPSRR